MFCDSHCHYNDEKFYDDLEEVIKYNIENDISLAVVAGYNISKSKEAIVIAKKYSKNMRAIVGISPNDVYDTNFDEIKKMALDKIVVGIGEIGLDYYWNKENKEVQKQAFIKQIEIANELDLPIVIHTREATLDTIQILKEHHVKNKGIFHCCPLNMELIKEGLKLGFYISFSGIITFKNSKADECIKLVPNDKMLIETDSPYLSPEPNRGKRNTPYNVKYVAEKIANVKALTVEEIANITYNNALNIYKIKDI